MLTLTLGSKNTQHVYDSIEQAVSSLFYADCYARQTVCGWAVFDRSGIYLDDLLIVHPFNRTGGFYNGTH